MKTKFPILLVDDDPDLIHILDRAAQDSFPEVAFTQVHSVAQAITYFDELIGTGPRLVLLDIDLKGSQSGIDLLAYLSAHPIARLIPVIMLTVISDIEAIGVTYSQGASAYVLKPFSLEEWNNLLRRFRDYWYHTVTLLPVIFKSKASSSFD